MSNEEQKIRSELEMDVERDLEEEIKDGIYHLALRLHRLYQHQKERKNNTISEVNISIRMDGGTKVKIKESKKEARENGRPRTSISENMQGVVAPNGRKFDWQKTLRSAPVTKKADSFDQPKFLRKVHTSNGETKIQRTAKNRGTLAQQKENVHIKNDQLELGWRE